MRKTLLKAILYLTQYFCVTLAPVSMLRDIELPFSTITGLSAEFARLDAMMDEAASELGIPKFDLKMNMKVNLAYGLRNGFSEKDIRLALVNFGKRSQDITKPRNNPPDFFDQTLGSLNRHLKRFFDNGNISVTMDDFHFLPGRGACMDPVNSVIYSRAYDPDPGFVFRDEEEDILLVNFHECLHFFAVGFCNGFLDEAFVEYFSINEVSSIFKIDHCTDIVPMVNFCSALLERMKFMYDGDEQEARDTLRRMYITGDVELLKRLLPGDEFEIIYLLMRPGTFSSYNGLLIDMVLGRLQKEKIKLFKELLTLENKTNKTLLDHGRIFRLKIQLMGQRTEKLTDLITLPAKQAFVSAA
ncbi:MAG: hypothetical protein JW774_00285 [Candidatus Aureabacteria bacterium]|nr:hypothetical protein [Candidatus Auribacterota bacterium]